ncbi:MAG TPA: helix-turn-helix domain-containing protein, partial [Sulfurovum sp.]
SAKNWLHLLKYRFDTGEFYGRNDGIQLNNLQFGHSERHEGSMFKGYSPKDCLTIGILQKNSGRVCVNHLKMELDNIIVIDDSKPYDFVSSHATLLALVSIRKSHVKKEIPWLLDATDKKFKDRNGILSKTIENEWERILKEPTLLHNVHEIDNLEKKITQAIKDSLNAQTGHTANLTKGEITAFEVKDFLLDSLKENISIATLSNQFNVSDRTLSNSFKSLFGITPKHFIKLLKLNHTHEDLQLADPTTTNVSDIALKWGFLHFSRFAKEYKSLFGVLPSETLASPMAI